MLGIPFLALGRAFVSPGNLRDLPIPPTIRTFKVGTNHFDRMLIGGALQLSKRETVASPEWGDWEGQFLGKAKIQE